jgi:hypothetical protein
MWRNSEMRKFVREAKSLLSEFQGLVGQIVLTVAALWGLVRLLLVILR